MAPGAQVEPAGSADRSEAKQSKASKVIGRVEQEDGFGSTQFDAKVRPWWVSTVAK